MKKKFVSKLLAVAVAVTMLGGLMACGGAETTESAAASEPAAAESSAPAETESASGLPRLKASERALHLRL